MVEPIPTDDFDDELLSAYVDGELAGDQLALVEQHLAADPRAAQLVDDLRSMSQELQCLPQETVGSDLRATIMQRAERAMLLGAQEQVTTVPDEATSGRRWIWAALALAASLLLTAYLPTLQREQEPLASAKRAPGGQTAAENLAVPRFEAVITDAPRPPALETASERESSSMRAGDVAAEKTMVDHEVAVTGRSPAKASPAPAAQGIAVEAGRAGETGETDEIQLTCLVHITLSDKDATREQFRKHLVDNGIEFRQGEDLPTHQRGASTEGHAFRSQPHRQPQRAAEAAKPEQWVWVEAQAEQIASVLQDFHADTFNCEAVRVTEVQPTQQSLAALRQWERTESQVAPSQRRAAERDDLAPKKLAPQKAIQGWATPLDANQVQAGKLKVDRQRLAPQRDFSPLASQPPIQVLFIVQQATSKPAADVREEATIPGR